MPGAAAGERVRAPCRPAPLRILDTPSEERFDRITRSAARMFGVPIVAISLVDEQRQWFKSRCGLDAEQTGRDVAFCAHAILQDEVFVVPDATAAPRFTGNPLVTGGPIHFVAQIADVTARRRTEEQLRQSQKLEAVGKLTGGLAHDFNNLLAVVLGNLQLIERSVADNDKAKRRIRAALDATERGAELTKRLLAFSRRQTLEPKTIDANELVLGMHRTLSGLENAYRFEARDLFTHLLKRR